MSNAENARIPHQEQWPADVIEYGPEVPLAELVLDVGVVQHAHLVRVRGRRALDRVGAAEPAVAGGAEQPERGRQHQRRDEDPRSLAHAGIQPLPHGG